MKKNFNIVNIRQGKGFTILEILMVITLIGILIVITVPLAANIVNRTELNSIHESLYNSILRAQNLSKIQYRNQQWRVCIDNTAKQYIIAAGTCSSPLYAETIKFSSNITVSSTQTLDLQFTSPKGELNYAGNFSKISLNGGGVSKSIIVNQNGVIDKAATSDPSNTTATPSIVTDGLVLNLDAGNIASYPVTGTTWTDLSGNNNNGTLVNGVGYNSGNGGSLIFDGVNDYVDVATNLNFNFGSDNFFVEFVCFFDSSTASDNLYRPIVYFGSGTTYFSIVKWRSGIGNGIVLDYSVSGNRYTITTTNATPSPNVSNTITSPLYDVVNKWSYISVSTISNVMTLYINGIAYGSVTLGSRWNQNLNLNIGSDGGSSYMKGNISLIRVYKGKGLTPAEIQQNFNATKSRFGL